MNEPVRLGADGACAQGWQGAEVAFRGSVSEELDDMFAKAEEGGRCLSVADRRLRSSIRARVNDGRLLEPFPRLFARSQIWNGLSARQRHCWIVKELSRLHPSWIFCGPSALAVYGIRVSHKYLSQVHICTFGDHPARCAPGIVRHPVQMADPLLPDGIPVVEPCCAVADALRTWPLPESLVVADSFLALTGNDMERFYSKVCEYSKGKNGAPHARRSAQWADCRAESGGESFARGVMIQAGVPPTDIQVTFDDPLDTTGAIRVDYLFELGNGLRVVAEFDGRQKYTDPAMRGGLRPKAEVTDVLLAERRRESRLTLLGMPVVRFDMVDAKNPGVLAHLLSLAGVTRDSLVRSDYRSSVAHKARH